MFLLCPDLCQWKVWQGAWDSGESSEESELGLRKGSGDARQGFFVLHPVILVRSQVYMGVTGFIFSLMCSGLFLGDLQWGLHDFSVG